MNSGPDETPPDAGAAETDASGPTEGATRVLFVDDEPGAADLAATHVERLVDGIETITRTSPDEALDAVRSERVDCVVSDFDMPGADGLELLESVRELGPGIPFVLFTGKGSEEIASEAISAGVTDYLQKGAGRDRYEMLANSVANALGRRRAERDLREVNAKVTAIHEFATALASVTEVSTVFERTVDAAEEILEFDRCVTARRRGDRVVPAVLSESVTEAEVRTFDVGEGVVGTTVADQETIVVDNLSVDPADPDELEDPSSPGRSASGTDRREGSAVADPVADNIRSAISVPIGSHGVLQAVSDGYAAFDERDVEFAELIASHAANAIERIETEAELRRERDRLTALFHDLPLPAVRTVALGEDGRRLDAANEAFERTFGYGADSGYEEVRDAIIPAAAERLEPEAVLERDEPSRRQVRRRTADGMRDFILHVIPVKQSGETVIYSVYADIEDQKRVERTLRRLHATTREMFGGEDRADIAALASRAAIDILEFPNSGVRLYDPEANVLRPTAISEEATEAFGDRPAFGPGDGRVWEAFETGQPVVVDDLAAVDTAVGYGELRSLLVVPLGDHGAMPLGAREPGFFDETDLQLARVLAANVTVALDHAERTEQLRDRDAALQREIDRLEKFAGFVSHDLRNPLNVAAGRADLARSLTDDAAVIEELDRAEDAHDRMSQLIDDLLALARQGRTVDEIESVPLDEAAERAWRTVDTDDATLDVSEATAAVEADPERLRTLFENLFINSVEHGSANSRSEPDDSAELGSDTDAEGDTDAADLTVSVGSLPDGFYVADDGAGFDIDPEAATEYGRSSASNGTGFGLAIVREIATAHGWELSIDGDDGARFEFRQQAGI
ncbi:multi-sensor signal transduction histidine kinase [Halorubrum distributum JCM 9100]|uniref:histidine kinase n=2 Tax=Halorubrum distributum TaxID=29283 RepID=M0EYM2_9EURY|nr:GAF domain-containing protein [Halorubrum distributum]ELZ51987.1 multi-sensor signal transduction histidine kinase [Halorubrum distributum JCM 9100]ELZ52047.1 multi-sensor signal transduction histidine kinase [Halorubrum distributum JCM 10118]